MDLQWIKIRCIYPINASLTDLLNDKIKDEDEDEHPILKKVRLENIGAEDNYKIDFAYINIDLDPIISLNPGCFKPKSVNQNAESEELKNTVYITQIILQSNGIIYAMGKPEAIYKQLNKDLSELVKEVKE